jgi:hypothetical protein
MPTQNENMNRREKFYAHLLPLHHDHDWGCLVTNAYTKLDHEHEHDQKTLWGPTSVWLPDHNDDPMLPSAYTKWKLRPTMNIR